MRQKVVGFISLSAPVVSLTFLINHFLPSLSPLFLSLLLGLIIGNLIKENEYVTYGSTYLSKYGMRAGVALLGFQITVKNIAQIGWKGFAAILIVVVTTFLSTRWLGVKLGFTPSLSLLMASGFSICGVSAITAVGAARKDDKDEISYAIGLVTLLGTLSIFVIPPLAHLFKLTSITAGSWIGAAVHDIGQVVATASFLGGTSMKYAVVTKLSRVVLLAPLLMILTIFGRTHHLSETENAFPTIDGVKKIAPLAKLKLLGFKNILPTFILVFLLCVIVNNFVHLSVHQSGFLNNCSKYLLALGLFSMAIRVKFASLRRIGGKPLLFGISMWVFFGGFSLVVLKLFGI
jgi:uncharacterized integral membrane protein (TIGR00698 family)